MDELKTSNSCFVVFNTEEDKEAAFANPALQEGIKFDARKYGHDVHILTMEEVGNEPANLNWHNFGEEDPNSAQIEAKAIGNRQ